MELILPKSNNWKHWRGFHKTEKLKKLNPVEKVEPMDKIQP